MVDPATLIMTGAAVVSAGANFVSAGAAVKPLLDDSDILIEAYSLKKNVEDFLARLCAMMKDYEKEVEAQKTKVPSETYKDWTKRVTATKEYIANMINKYSKHEKQLSSVMTRELKNQKIEVETLIKEGEGITKKLLVRAPPEVAEKMKAPDFKNSKTLQDKLDKILKLLETQDVKGVTVYGTMGVGKTAILKNLNNHEKIAQMFDMVIWMKVSEEKDQGNLSIKHLQKNILRRLKLKFKGNKSIDDVARRITKELESKKYLLLMDDVKEDINLSDIGFPSNQKGCKVVLTTRQVHVCRELICEAVKVEYFSNDEAWHMFRDVLQCPSLIENPKIGPVAWEICKQCGGLPLLIEKVASTFKVKHDERLWRDGLNSWRLWPEKDFQGIKEMINFFKVCYKDLDDPQKQCFLYGALYPEDSDICTDYLLERWRAEDFLVIDHRYTNENGMGEDYLVIDHNYTKENEAVSGSSVLSHLKNVGLLEESKSYKHVSMHKFIRQVALDISSRDPTCLYLVKTNRELVNPVDARSWYQKRYISLSNNDSFHRLPDHPDGSMLSTLFLQKNSRLKEVPKSFFNNMNKLRVLDFCDSGITFLPESPPSLSSLKVLCLSDCISLEALPLSLNNLSYLEVLDIRRSGIEGIPKHIEKLKRLRFLRISLPKTTSLKNTTILKTGNEDVIIDAFETISNLPQLEELVVDMQWSDQCLNKVVITSVIKNTAMLENFTSLRFSTGEQIVDIIEMGSMIFRVQVPDVEVLQAFSQGSCFYERAKQLQKFQIFIDCKETEKHNICNYVKYPIYIRYFNGNGNYLLLPEKKESDIAFELVSHKDIREVSNFKVPNAMNKIKEFFVGSCKEIVTIIGATENEVLSNIEHLHLDKLPKLESIWKEPLQNWLCLTNLLTLFISGCPNLTKIFPCGAVQQLTGLKDLRIEDCSKVVKILEESETKDKPNLLPNLKRLDIHNMLELEFICEEKSFIWPSLVELHVSMCPSLQQLTITREYAPKLEVFDVFQ